MIETLRKYGVILILSLLPLALAACAETQLVAHTAKQMQVHRPASPSAMPYKVGNPYQINGVWYYPKVDYQYRQSGIASWYGPGFHGRRTANGERFDQNAITAAHQTLPLPSMVRITNLENGRSLKIRVNDRGPFANNRIIDLSRRAAQLLGFEEKGTAKVKVEILEAESRMLAARVTGEEDADGMLPPAVPLETVTAQQLAPVGAPQNNGGGLAENATVGSAAMPVQAAARPTVEPVADGRVTRVPVGRADLFVQAGAFVEVYNAVRLKARLSPLGATRIVEARVGDSDYFRVQIGPLGQVEDADRVLRILLANGIVNAQVVVD